MGLLRTNQGVVKILLQRVNITLTSKKDPTSFWSGYLVLTERGQESIFFFSNKKISKGTLLIMTIHSSEEQKLEIEVDSCHDQVSSGRVMRPEKEEAATESGYFPSCMYYRCYAKVKIACATTVPGVAVQEAEPVVEAAPPVPETQEPEQQAA